MENEADWHNFGTGGKTYWYFSAFPHCDPPVPSRNWAEWEPTGLISRLLRRIRLDPEQHTQRQRHAWRRSELAGSANSVLQADSTERDAVVSQAGNGGSWILLTSFVRLDGTTFITANDDDAADAACDNKIIATDAIKLVLAAP